MLKIEFKLKNKTIFGKYELSFFIEFLIINTLRLLKTNLKLKGLIGETAAIGIQFGTRPFFQKFVLAAPQEVLGDERRNEWYAPTS